MAYNIFVINFRVANWLTNSIRLQSYNKYFIYANIRAFFLKKKQFLHQKPLRNALFGIV